MELGIHEDRCEAGHNPSTTIFHHNGNVHGKAIFYRKNMFVNKVRWDDNHG